LLSPPSREAWIETRTCMGYPALGRRRLPHGGRGLKLSVRQDAEAAGKRRLPHGRRGLKLPPRRVWRYRLESPPSREAWIETDGARRGNNPPWSPPSREAWIETPF